MNMWRGVGLSLLVYSPNTLRIFDASCQSFGHGALLSHAPFCRRLFLEGIIYVGKLELRTVPRHGNQVQASKETAINSARNTTHSKDCWENTHPLWKHLVLKNTTVSIICMLKPPLILFLSAVGAMRRLIPVKIAWWNVAAVALPGADIGCLILNHVQTLHNPLTKSCTITVVK